MCRWLKAFWLYVLFFPLYVQAQGVIVDSLYQEQELEIEEMIEDVISDSAYQKAEAERYRYLEEGYYDSIASARPFEGDIGQSFGEMLPKYQTEEFAYSESITTKLSFLDRVRKRFWKFIEDYFPKKSLFSEEDFYNVLAVLGLIFILYLCYHFFIGKNKIYTHIKKEKGEKEEEIAFVERNLMDVDVRKYIAEAVGKQDYALAIRYQQLLNIQTLNKKSLIEWDYTKTNAELMEGVKNEELRQSFLACASLFDRAWFGDFKVNDTDYRGIAQEFEQFQKRWA